MIISLPNVRHIRNLFDLIVRKEWEYQDAGVLDRTHLRFFTKKSATRMVREAGYSLEVCQGIDPSRKWYIPIFNILTLGFFSDARFVQFAFRARC